MTDRSFLWYRANGDGTADVFEDSKAVQDLVDSGTGQWYGNPEGAIIHGGVIASSFTRNVAMTYDSEAWLMRRERIERGERVTVTVTASLAS